MIEKDGQSYDNDWMKMPEEDLPKVDGLTHADAVREIPIEDENAVEKAPQMPSVAREILSSEVTRLQAIIDDVQVRLDQYNDQLKNAKGDNSTISEINENVREANEEMAVAQRDRDALVLFLDSSK